MCTYTWSVIHLSHCICICKHFGWPPSIPLVTYIMDGGLFLNQKTRTFEYCIHQNINIWKKKILHKKINIVDSRYEINILGSSINVKPNSKMSVILCKAALLYFVKKNYLVARIVSFNTVKSWSSIFLNSEFCILTQMFTI